MRKQIVEFVEPKIVAFDSINNESCAIVAIWKEFEYEKMILEARTARPRHLIQIKFVSNDDDEERWRE